jgi:DNA-binding XRE family transcriptional regulator
VDLLVYDAETNSPAAMPADEQSTRSTKARLAYSRNELAALLGISARSLKRLEDRGLIKSSKALRTKLYPHHEVMRFLDRSG